MTGHGLRPSDSADFRLVLPVRGFAQDSQPLTPVGCALQNGHRQGPEGEVDEWKGWDRMDGWEGRRARNTIWMNKERKICSMSRQGGTCL